MRCVLANPGGMDTVNYTFSVTLDMHVQSYFNKTSTRLSPLEAHIETIVIFAKVSSLRKRSVSNDLT